LRQYRNFNRLNSFSEEEKKDRNYKVRTPVLENIIYVSLAIFYSNNLFKKKLIGKRVGPNKSIFLPH